MNFISKLKTKQWLDVELLCLSLMLLSLPSFEAPKNIFLIFFVLIASFRHLLSSLNRGWCIWDSVFLSIILSGLLSTIFAGLSPGDEWKGFRVLLTFISVGWLLYRSNYSNKQISWLFGLTILAVIPPLCWGLWELLVLHLKDTLQLHSVGHVNHSAIYLTIIFGASLGLTLSMWGRSNALNKLALFLLPCLFYISLVIGQSRAAFGIGTIMGITFIYLLAPSKKIKWIGFSILPLVMAAIFFLNAPILQKQIENKNNHNVLSGRGAIWNVTVEAARLYPILGIGIDNRAVVTKDIIQRSVESRHEIFDESRYNFHFKHSHSFYLTQIAERGILGASVTIIFLIIWLQTLARHFLQKKLTGQALYLWAGSESAWFATFGIGFVNTTFHHEHGILACVFLGLHLAFLNKKQKAKPI
jgi:O-antigen ligase